MPIKVRDFESLLQQKFGFVPAPERSTNHRWYKLQIPGLPAIYTMISHGHTELSSNLEGQIAKQLRVRKPFFNEMFSCTKSSDEYQKQITESPYPTWNFRF